MTSHRVLITGGAGFIGSHLADRLLMVGHRVTILDDLSTGRFSNIEHIEGHPNVEFICDTVMNESLVSELIRGSDRVYHLASAVGVKLIMERPVGTIETIVGGTEIVLRHCARFRKRVLLTSTSEVYGKGVAVPFQEDDDVLTGSTTKHRWAYACAKALDEFLAMAHWKENRLAVCIARLFNTVGPRQTGQYGMVVPRFARAALLGEPLVVFGDGEQTRCFAHVADVVDALSRMLDVSKCFGQVINIGNDEEISINDLARETIEVARSSSVIKHLSYEQAYGDGFEDMQRRSPSLEKAKALIGYRPSRSLRAILVDVIGDQRALLGVPAVSEALPSALPSRAAETPVPLVPTAERTPISLVAGLESVAPTSELTA